MEADQNESPGRAWGERRVLISLAGDIAQRRALQGSEPGWCRMLSPEQSICFHEAGHAAMAHAVGWHVYDLNIDPPTGLVVETGASIAGYCTTDSRPWPKGSLKPSTTGVMDSDRHKAATFCLLMGGDWQGALRCLRGLRARAADLIEQNWRAVKSLAYELEQKRQLDQDQISHILNGVVHQDRG